MGREIRRVPANWEHPRYTTDTATRRDLVGQYIPLQDNYDQALERFTEDISKMGLGEAIEYHGGGPLRDDHANYEGKPLDWWQAYETVSEGTPVSPAFATAEELIKYLVKNGDFWDQQRSDRGMSTKCGYSQKAAEEFVRGGWAPSAMMINGNLFEGAEALAQSREHVIRTTP